MKKQRKLFCLDDESVEQLDFVAELYVTSKSGAVERLIKRGFSDLHIEFLEDLRSRAESRPNSLPNRVMQLAGLRQRVISERGATCEGACGDSNNINLHHITYERYGMEDSDDVALLCTLCHSYVHKVGKPGKRTRYANLTGIGGGKECEKFTLYLPLDMVKFIKQRALDQGKTLSKYISDLVTGEGER